MAGPNIQLFPTAAFLKGDAWEIVVKGWIYQDNHSRAMMAASRRILSAFYPSEQKQFNKNEIKEIYTQRAAPFLAKPVNNAKVRINVLLDTKLDGKWNFTNTCTDPMEYDQKSIFDLNVYSDSSGIFEYKFTIPNTLLPKDHNTVTIIAFKKCEPQVGTLSTISLVSPEGISIISDIDDTIKDSSVYMGKIAAVTEGLLGAHKEVPDMASVYNCLSAKNIAFHYVSAGPFQLLPTLKTYMKNFEFPAGSLTLRILGETGTAYKLRTIISIIEV